MTRIKNILIGGIICVNLWLIPTVAAQSPEILKVDPPSWWPLTQLNPVRLMIRGRNLQRARVRLIGPGIDLGTTTINERGTYIFVDIGIANDATPGKRGISITTPRGSTRAEFEILPPLNHGGRFQGFSPADVMY